MPPLSPPLHAQAVQYLLLGWQADAIAEDIRCQPATIYRLRWSLLIRDTPNAPRVRMLGGPKKLTKSDEDSLLEFLDRYPASNQGEMVRFLWEERGKRVDQSTVSRVLKRRKRSKKDREYPLPAPQTSGVPITECSGDQRPRRGIEIRSEAQAQDNGSETKECLRNRRTKDDLRKKSQGIESLQ